MKCEEICLHVRKIRRLDFDFRVGLFAGRDTADPSNRPRPVRHPAGVHAPPGPAVTPSQHVQVRRQRLATASRDHGPRPPDRVSFKFGDRAGLAAATGPCSGPSAVRPCPERPARPTVSLRKRERNGGDPVLVSMPFLFGALDPSFARNV